ncbi:MAG: alpha-L-fucosidase [Defluviitaleaceae bacterium]|nr:alpha-L-fucosidase [Defluviitaleaceae bacterium]
MRLLPQPEYEETIKESRDERIGWWREARFGMFVHFGIYTALGRHEWAMALENWSAAEYEKFADRFNPAPGAPREWAKLALSAGMKYMVMTSRHHEGFSLWDSKANPYNSVNLGPKRDIVREYVEACREFGLKIGFYTSLIDWHNPDCGAAAYDGAARKRFTDYIYALNEELLTQYGKIDILWFDVASPMAHAEGWNSVEMIQRLRAMQPHIIVNDRARLPEDFGTPEEHITASSGDWEACMTFNGLSWGYIDSNQAGPYSYNACRILRMLNTCASGGGNLLLNIGPRPDGSVPPETIEPLEQVGRWLGRNGDCAYGKMDRSTAGWGFGSGICGTSMKDNTIYLWNWIFPTDGELYVGGTTTRLIGARVLSTGEKVEFEQEKYRIKLKNLSERHRDGIAGVCVVALEFESKPEIIKFAATPALNRGKIYG